MFGHRGRDQVLGFLNLQDKETAILFGDGAGAVVVVGEESVTSDAPGIVGVRLYAEGSGHDLITIPAGGSRQPSSLEGAGRQGTYIPDAR